MQNPEGWGGMLASWAINILPAPVTSIMIFTALLDLIIGFFLLIDVFTWLAALIGSAHIAVVLITVGINAITVRDIGLFAAALALSAAFLPPRLRFWEQMQTKKGRIQTTNSAINYD